jgi:hypothetical protein
MVAPMLGPTTGPTIEPTTGGVLRMKLLHANPAAKVTGTDELPGTSSYFIGNDPKKWRSNVPTYAKVKYEGIYSGIDLVYYGNQRQLEYDFVVAPGADPSRIRFKFRGAGTLRIDDRGDLLLEAEGDEIRLQKPQVYQETSGTRKAVEGHYRMAGANTISFRVADYDRSRPLIIDPVLVYSTYLGGTSTDIGIGIAVDSSGNAYLTGETTSTNFPTVNALQSSCGGGCANGSNAFVAKINASGSALIYSTYLGGSVGDQGVGVAVDSSDNAYVTGYTQSSDFPTVNALQSSIGSGRVADAFVAKINASGSALIYSTYLGGSGSDVGSAIAVDSSGNAYVTGATYSSNFPTVNALQSMNGGNGGEGNAFVAKINASGSALIYSTYLGGSGNGGGNTAGDLGTGIAVDSSGNAYVIGFASSSNFPTVNALQSIYGGGTYDAFVAKINASGSALIYSTYLGGSQSDGGDGIVVDSSDNAYVTGFTQSTDFPTVNPIQANLRGGGNAFIAKINASGSALIYSTYLGGSGGNDVGVGIAVDSSGNGYVTGGTNSTDFPTVNPIQTSISGVSDAFVAKINASGSALVYSTYLGGSGSDNGSGIAVDSAGNAYITGTTTSTNFPTMNPLQPANAGGEDAFVVKIASVSTDNIPPTTIATPSPVPNSNGWNNTNVTVALHATDNLGGSGVKRIQFALSGAENVALQTVAGNAASVTISAEGTTLLTYFATDNAGNQETVKTLIVRIDKTPPVISGLPARECTIWPPNHKLVQVAKVTAADALSGLAPGSFKVTGTSNDPDDGKIVIISGPSQFIVQLGADKSQVYTLTATAIDLAGNTVTEQATCTVRRDQKERREHRDHASPDRE